MKFQVLTLSGVLAVQSMAGAAYAATTVKAGKASDKKPAAATAAKDGKEKEKTGPAKLSVYSSQEDYDRDAAADQRRDEAISELTKILPGFDDGGQKADLMYRLGELYWEKQRFSYFQEFKLFDEAVEKWTEGGRQGPEPKVDSTKSDSFKHQALGIYDQILAKYPDYPRNDEVLFNKASALYEANDKTTALDLYFQLVKRYPQSDFLADTYLAMGEHYFASNDLPRATTAYQKAVQSNKPRIYSFAIYKLAWCDYNAQDYAGAIDKFKKVVDFSEKGQGKKKKKDRVQRTQALKDMLLAYSQIDAIDEAREYYTAKLERAELADYLGKLGLLYEDQGKWDLEVKTLKLVNAEWPNSRKAPSYQAAIIGAYSHLSKRDKVKEEVRHLIDLYKPGAAWAVANQGNKEALDEGFELTERALRELTTEYHAEAQKTKDEKTYVLAGDLYKEYLDAFPTSETAYRMRFNYAEILYRNKQFEKAAEQYDLVVDADSKGKLLKESAFASVQAWEAIVEGASSGDREKGKPKLDLGKIEKLEKGKSYDAEPIPEAELKLANACQRFVKVLPNDPDVVKVKFKEARIYFIHNHFEEAAPRFTEIIEKWPNDKLGRMAAALVLESFNVKQNWVELNKYARQYREHKELTKDASFAKELQDFVEGSQFKIVQGVEAKGEYAEAGRGYRAFVEEFPKSKFADVSLYNAMVISDKGGELDVAIPSAEKLLKEYPAATTRETTMFMVAQFYERIGEFEKSLKAYDAFAEKYPKSPKAQDAQFNSALFNDALGNNKAAIAGYEKYLKDYPKAKDAMPVYLKISKIYERTGDDKKLVEHILSLEKRFPDVTMATVFAGYKTIAKSYMRTKKDKELQATWTTIVARYGKLKDADKKDDMVVAVTAQARFELFDPTFKSYLALKLTLKQLQDSLMKKTKSLNELEKEYVSILAMGNGDYGIASLTRLGQAYQDFSKTLFDAPMPQNLSDEQREIYQAELQDRAFPIEEKAIEAYEKALAKSRDLRVYNQYSTLAQERMAGFKPSEYPEVHKYAVAADEPFATTQLLTKNDGATAKPAATEAPKAEPVKSEPAKEAEPKKPEPTASVSKKPGTAPKKAEAKKNEYAKYEKNKKHSAKKPAVAKK